MTSEIDWSHQTEQRDYMGCVDIWYRKMEACCELFRIVYTQCTWSSLLMSLFERS